MYTIGTSSLKLLRARIKETLPLQIAVYEALDKRLLAFVGTSADRLGVKNQQDPTKNRPPTIISPYSAFFQYTDADEQVQLYIPKDKLDPGNRWPLTPDTWALIGDPFNEAFITEWLKPAGGLANGLYATQRGNLADIERAFKHSGLTYFAKDTKELYIYVDDNLGWVPASLNASDKDPIGSIVTYPDHFAMTDVIKVNWMRCDGHVMTPDEQAKHHAFAELIKGVFTSDPTECKLPIQSNAIIRVSA